MRLFKKKPEKPKEPEKQEKTMSDYEAWRFIFHTKRCEGEDYPVPYTKAIRVVLREMGYEPSWIEGRFRHILDAVYFDEKTNLDDIVAEWERYLDEEAGIYPGYDDYDEDSVSYIPELSEQEKAETLREFGLHIGSKDA